jgi:hypothetical protein
MVIVVLVVFGVVIFLATGRGGELSRERNDFVPLDLGPVTATDIALLRPPTALWGYNMQATDDAMDQIAASIRERDVRIVALEQLVTDLSRDHAPALPLASPYPAARHRRPPGSGAETESLAWADSVDDGDPAGGRQETLESPAFQETAAPENTAAAEEPTVHPEATVHQETSVHQETTMADQVRLDFDPARPGPEQPGPPPERTHD